jgi:hypothetical protein
VIRGPGLGAWGRTEIGEGHGVPGDPDGAGAGVEGAVVAATEQHRVVHGQVAVIGEGGFAVGDIAPGRRRVAARPHAALIAHQERPPQSRGHGADLRADLDRRSRSIQDEPHQLAVGDHLAELTPGHRLARVQQGAGDLVGSVLELGELTRAHGDDDLGSRAVLGGGLTGSKRRRTQLLERVRAPLVRGAMLVRGIRAAEGAQRDPDLLGSDPVEGAGDRQSSVFSVRSAEPPPGMLAAFVPSERRSLFPTEDRPGKSTEGDRIVLAGQGEQLDLDRLATLEGDVGEDAGDRLCVGGSKLTLSERRAGPDVVRRGPAGIQDPLGLGRAEPLLPTQLLLMVGQDPADLLRGAPTDLRALRRSRRPGPHAFQLAQQPGEFLQEPVKLVRYEVVHLDTSQGTKGRTDGLQPFGEHVSIARSRLRCSRAACVHRIHSVS